VVVPDAPTLAAPGAPQKLERNAEFTRGNVARGRELFDATCATCHTFRGRGALVGPDLGNSPDRDPLALLADITAPNASLNPDHIGYELTRRDGMIVVGVIASDRPGRFLVRQPGGSTVVIEETDIVAQRQLPKSLMPEGYAELGEEKLRDLVTYLTTAVEAGGR
jgi:putative heme-binding domain-containing protein